MLFGLFGRRTRPAPSLPGPSIRLSVGITPPTADQEVAWAKKREATALSRAGDTWGAVAALEEAQRIAGGEAEIHDEIRRAKYLQKDGRDEEAWIVYARILKGSRSPWTDVDVLDAMRLHLQRDGQAERAIPYGIAHRLARVTLYRDMKREAEEAIAGPMPADLAALGDGPDDPWLADIWKRQKQNHLFSIELANKWLEELTDAGDLAKMVAGLAKKAKIPERMPALIQAVTKAIDNSQNAREFLSNELQSYGG